MRYCPEGTECVPDSIPNGEWMDDGCIPLE